MTPNRISRGKKGKAISRGASRKQLATGKGKGTSGKRIERFGDDDDADAYRAKESKRKQIDLKLEDEKLVITLGRVDPPTPSRSRKSYLIATTGGVKQTRLLVKGLPVHVVATAFIYGDCAPPVKWVPLLEVPEDYYNPRLANDQDREDEMDDDIPELIDPKRKVNMKS